jgi:two-component system, OmpR family, sensor kinase
MRLPMFKRIRPILLIIGLPLILGGLASILIQAFLHPVPILLFKIDIGTAVFVTGIFLTALAAAFYSGAFLQDRQARKKLEDSMQEAERSRNRFLRRLDHEIKNPLTGLQAALANLRESSSLQERERAALNADRAVERLASLLADLRKLTDLAERPPERLPVEVPELLEEMVEAAHSQPAYMERQISLMITRVPSHLPAVTGDRDLLGLAVYNLIENALKFTSAGDSVEVRALEDGKAIIVEVADTGPGIAPDDLESVFEELYRGKNARGVDGSGLGLALTQRIVDLHGAQIAVRSHQAEPRGTVFTLRLPISSD